MKYCMQCGSEYQDDVKECADCPGSTLVDAETMRERHVALSREHDTQKFVRAATADDPLTADDFVALLEKEHIPVFSAAPAHGLGGCTDHGGAGALVGDHGARGVPGACHPAPVARGEHPGVHGHRGRRGRRGGGARDGSHRPPAQRALIRASTPHFWTSRSGALVVDYERHVLPYPTSLTDVCKRAEDRASLASGRPEARARDFTAERPGPCPLAPGRDSA